jgi:hypothetical protein
MAVCQNLVPLVNIKIAGKWMFIPLKMVLIGIDPYPYHQSRSAKKKDLLQDLQKTHSNYSDPSLSVTFMHLDLDGETHGI